ncbi:MAG: hypothetical protein ACHQQS_10490 [Thermoanaerobaculales bacterium]
MRYTDEGLGHPRDSGNEYVRFYLKVPAVAIRKNPADLEVKAGLSAFPRDRRQTERGAIPDPLRSVLLVVVVPEG